MSLEKFAIEMETALEFVGLTGARDILREHAKETV
jgi:magnesium-transporting ATPase (P-type)